MSGFNSRPVGQPNVPAGFDLNAWKQEAAAKLGGPVQQPQSGFDLNSWKSQAAQQLGGLKIGDAILSPDQISGIEKDGDNSERLVLAVEKRRTKPEDFGLSKKQGWGSYVAERLPFYAHGLFDKAKAAKDAVTKLEAPDKMDQGDIDNIANVIVEQELRSQEDSQKGILQKGVDIATHVPAMGVEIATTLGSGFAAKNVAKQAAKKGVEKLLPTFVSKALQSGLAKVTEKAAGRYAGKLAGLGVASAVAAQHPLMAPKNVMDTAERMLPSVQGDQVVLGESLGNAYFNNSVDKTIETFTEQLGPGGIGKLGKAIGGTRLGQSVAQKVSKLSGYQMAVGLKNSAAKWLGERVGLKVPEALKVLADKAKYNGVLGEMIEERYGEGLRGVSDAFFGTDISQGGVTQDVGSAAYNALKGEYGDAADNLLGAMAQLAVEGIGFGLVSGAGRAAGFTSKAAGFGYEHTPEHAQQWANQNPQAAQLLASKKPEELSRSLFASLGLPVNTGKKAREEFHDWVASEPYFPEDDQQTQQPAQEVPPVEQVQEPQQADQPEISKAQIPSPDDLGAPWKDNLLESVKTWQNRGTPDQLRAHLLKTKGTKEYSDWIGLDSFLEGKTSVTKQEVEQYVKDNEVQIEEVEKGKPEQGSQWWWKESLEGGSFAKHGPYQSKEDALAQAEGKFEWSDDAAGWVPVNANNSVFSEDSNTKNPTKYHNYKTPGGKDYRELLLTLPQKDVELEWDFDGKEIYESKPQGSATVGRFQVYPLDSKGGMQKWEVYDRVTQKSYMALSLIQAKKFAKRIAAEQFPNKEPYSSSHFDDKNIIAHVRFDTREVGDKKVLFIDEVQSDWHQEGREKGYKGRKKVAEDPLMGLLNEGDNSVMDSGVPDAPYKTSWPMLAVRRMIRYAVENGYDSIAFTTGEQQAERYNLSKTISSIEYNQDDGNSLSAWSNDGSPVIDNRRTTPEELPSIIGKEAARKLLESVEEDGINRLDGEALAKVGGEGMKGFYDQILPAEINKFLKKYGGKVGVSEIPVPSESGNMVPVGEPDAEGLQEFSIPETSTVKVHSFDIPESLRQDAIKGVTKFAKAGASIPKKRPLSRLSGTPGETSIGKSLIKQMKEENSKVGLRSMTDFLAYAVHALMIRTTSQVSSKHPAHYIGGRMNSKGEWVLPAYHTVTTEDGSHTINFHELGHALSTLFKNNDRLGYAKWLGYWEEALKLLSNQGYSSVPNSLEEGIAEAMRYYIQDQTLLEANALKSYVRSGGKTVKKTFLEGLNELLDTVAPEEAKAFRDANRMYLIHDARSQNEKTQVNNRDKGYKPAGLGKAMEQKWHDFLVGLYGPAEAVQIVLKRAFEHVSGTKQFGLISSITGVIKTVYSKEYRESVKKAVEFFEDLKKNGIDIESAYNNIARIRLEVQRILHPGITQQKGVRFFVDEIKSPEQQEMMKNTMKSLRDAGLYYNFSMSGVDGTNPETGEKEEYPPNAEHGAYVYLIDKNGEHVPLYHEIKAAIGEKWEQFEAYGYNKTTVARITRHPDWDYPGKGTDSIEDIAASVEADEKANPEFLENYKKVEKLMDAYLSLDVISGERSVEDAIRIKDAYEHYWPQDRDVSLRSSNEKKGGGGGSHFDYDIERASGSGLPFKRLDEIIFNRTKRIIQAYNYGRMLDTFLKFKNEVAKKLDGKFKEQVEWARTVIPIGPDMKAVDIPMSKEAEIVANYLNGIEAEKLGISVEELVEEGLGVDPRNIEISTPSKPLWKEAHPNMVQVVRRRKGDMIQYFHIPDPFLFQIFEGNPHLVSSKDNPFMAAAEILGNAITPFKRVVTRSPVFALYNTFYRDPRTTLVTGESWNPYHNTWKAIRAIIRGWSPTTAKRLGLGKLTEFDKEANNETFALYSQNTAPLSGISENVGQKILGSFNSMLSEGFTHKEGIPIDWSPHRVGWWRVANSAVGAAFSAILKPMDAINWASGGWFLSPRGEALTRAGGYISARERGATQEQAVMAADNGTANFNQRSNRKHAIILDKQAMFFNPRMQVGYQLYKKLFDKNPYVRGTALLKLGYSSVMHAAIPAAIVLTMKAMGDDELNKWLEEWLKKENDRTDSDKMRMGSIPLLNGLSLKVPFDDGIPSMFDSFGWNMAISHLAEAKSRGETVEEAASGILARATSMLGPSLSQLINPLVRTAIESNINFNFYKNARIIPDGVASIYEKKQQTLPSTPESYNQAAEWLDKYGIEASPLGIRHIVTSIGLTYIDQISAFQDKKTAKEAGDLPIIGKLFTKEPKGFSSQPVLTLSEMSRRFDSAKKELEKIAVDGTEQEKQEAMSKLVSLQGYKAWYTNVYGIWENAKKLRKAGRPEEALQMERLMTETARRGLKEIVMMKQESP